MREKILNIAAGKFPPILSARDPYFLVNIDTMYYRQDDPVEVENKIKSWAGGKDEEYNINADIFEFMERTIMNFDRVCIYRFLEHVSFTKLLYFIYLVSTITKPGSVVDVIVPNYEILARMVLDEDPLDPAGGNFEAQNILLTTELLNEPSCPHASIWTPQRAIYFWELEGRFVIENGDLNSRYVFDGRDIYLRFKAKRV